MYRQDGRVRLVSLWIIQRWISQLMDYSGLCSFSISLTLPGSCSFHSSMVVLKIGERSRDRRYNSGWQFMALPWGMRIGLASVQPWGGVGGRSLGELSILGCFKAYNQPPWITNQGTKAITQIWIMGKAGGKWSYAGLWGLGAYPRHSVQLD